MLLQYEGGEVDFKAVELAELGIDNLSRYLLDVAEKIGFSDEELSSSLSLYASAFSKISSYIADGREKNAQEALNKIATFGDFLKREWREGERQTVKNIIHSHIPKDSIKDFDDRCYKADKFLYSAATKVAFRKAVEDAQKADPDPKGVYPLQDYLKDAQKRGFGKKDLEFLQNVYNCIRQIPGDYAAQYIKDIFRNEEMDRKKLVVLSARFVRSNHMDTGDYAENEKKVVKFYNDRYIRSDGWLSSPGEIYNLPDLRTHWETYPVKLLELVSFSCEGENGENEIDGKYLAECYRVFAGENEKELNELKEMFNTEKGFFGGSDTAEYTAAKNALDEYMTARKGFQDVIGKVTVEYFKEDGSISEDKIPKAEIAEAAKKLKRTREACEDLMKAYISKKTNGIIKEEDGVKHYRLGSKDIDDMVQGAGSARLASALSILDVLRVERGSSGKADRMQEKQKNMKTKVTTFATLYKKEKGKEGVGRKKASEIALKTMKEKKKKNSKTNNKTNNKGKSI